jgi:uncharacterized membrane protein YedE/YeeE
MLRSICIALSGLVFGLGLCISQMVDPVKVLGFLDIAGKWDPSLALVMMSALIVAAPGFLVVLRRTRPIYANEFPTPSKRDIDPSLIAGGVLFGCGWGLVGFCPGPSIASLAYGLPSSFIFVAALVAGISLANSFAKAFNKKS